MVSEIYLCKTSEISGVRNNLRNPVPPVSFAHADIGAVCYCFAWGLTFAREMDTIMYREEDMDKIAILLRAVELIPNFLPKQKPPVIDYSPLYEAIPKSVEMPKISATEIEVRTEPASIEKAPESSAEETVATGCISCSRSHLSTISGALGESLRFAREDGIQHPEVQRRIMMSEDEANIMERIDLAPDALLNSPPEERQLAEEYLPRIRKLRQGLGGISSVDKLEEVAGEASLLAQEFRLRHLQLQGVNLSPVMALAKKVQAGELTMEEAKIQLKELLPEEE